MKLQRSPPPESFDFRSKQRIGKWILHFFAENQFAIRLFCSFRQSKCDAVFVVVIAVIVIIVVIVVVVVVIWTNKIALMIKLNCECRPVCWMINCLMQGGVLSLMCVSAICFFSALKSTGWPTLTVHPKWFYKNTQNQYIYIYCSGVQWFFHRKLANKRLTTPSIASPDWYVSKCVWVCKSAFNLHSDRIYAPQFCHGQFRLDLTFCSFYPSRMKIWPSRNNNSNSNNSSSNIFIINKEKHNSPLEHLSVQKQSICTFPLAFRVAFLRAR